eukprot:8407879-Pyramimonas_sp.AAC.1
MGQSWGAAPAARCRTQGDLRIQKHSDPAARGANTAILTQTLVHNGLKDVDMTGHSELPCIDHAEAQRLAQFGDPPRRDGALQGGHAYHLMPGC